jgi:hypothetical protein
VTALGLCAPAVYAAEAWSVRFDAGFTGIIREPESWRRSAAVDVLRAYEGRAVLAVPATDAVIPPAVTEEIADALETRARFTHLVLEQADHQLGLWFRDNAEDRARFVDALLADGPGWTGTRAWVEMKFPRDLGHVVVTPRGPDLAGSAGAFRGV